MNGTTREIQTKDLAGKTKLTSVTITCNGRKQQTFLHLVHDEAGAARIPVHVLDNLLRRVGAARGDTYTIA